MGRPRNIYLAALRAEGVTEYRLRKIRETNKLYKAFDAYERMEQVNIKYALNESTPELTYETVLNEILSGNEATATDVQKRYYRDLQEFIQTGETTGIKELINSVRDILLDIGVTSTRDDLKEILVSEERTAALKEMLDYYAMYRDTGANCVILEDIREDISYFIKTKNPVMRHVGAISNASLYLEK